MSFVPMPAATGRPPLRSCRLHQRRWAAPGQRERDRLAAGAAIPTYVRSSATAKKTQKQEGKKIVVKAKVKAEEDLEARGKGQARVGKRAYPLRPVTKNVTSGSSKTLKLKPKKKKDARKIAKTLKKGKKAKAKLTVKLSDEAGNEKTEKLKVKLKRQSGRG